MAGSSHYAGVLADLPCFVESYVDPSPGDREADDLEKECICITVPLF